MSSFASDHQYCAKNWRPDVSTSDRATILETLLTATGHLEVLVTTVQPSRALQGNNELIERFPCLTRMRFAGFFFSHGKGENFPTAPTVVIT